MFQQAKRFGAIDKNWVKIMNGVEENPNLVKHTGSAELYELLRVLFESLETCQKSLTSYLEQKRRIFPRFYFVSDAQLLEILGQGLVKLFSSSSSNLSHYSISFSFDFFALTYPCFSWVPVIFLLKLCTTDVFENVLY